MLRNGFTFNLKCRARPYLFACWPSGCYRLGAACLDEFIQLKGIRKTPLDLAIEGSGGTIGFCRFKGHCCPIGLGPHQFFIKICARKISGRKLRRSDYIDNSVSDALGIVTNGGLGRRYCHAPDADRCDNTRGRINSCNSRIATRICIRSRLIWSLYRKTRTPDCCVQSRLRKRSRSAQVSEQNAGGNSKCIFQGAYFQMRKVEKQVAAKMRSRGAVRWN